MVTAATIPNPETDKERDLQADYRFALVVTCGDVAASRRWALRNVNVDAAPRLSTATRESMADAAPLPARVSHVMRHASTVPDNVGAGMTAWAHIYSRAECRTRDLSDSQRERLAIGGARGKAAADLIRAAGCDVCVMADACRAAAHACDDSDVNYAAGIYGGTTPRVRHSDPDRDAGALALMALAK